jgi:hypothetical protein
MGWGDTLRASVPCVPAVALTSTVGAATITMHNPDSHGRVFVDLVGKIEDGDAEIFQAKTTKVSRQPMSRCPACENSRTPTRHDHDDPPQSGSSAAGEPHGGDHVPSAGRFSLRRHQQRAGHPDEAGGETRGAPLSGLAVKVTSGFFLLGLLSVESEKERNIQLLKERAWFDIPVVYNNGRRAIVAVEKGRPW